MHSVCVRSGRTLEDPTFPDRPDRQHQVASRSNGYEANSNDGARNLQMVWSDRSRGDKLYWKTTVGRCNKSAIRPDSR